MSGMHCLNCKYDLRNLSEHRCPECGAPFDPSDPSTFDSPLIRRWLVKKWVVRVLVCAALSYAITLGCVWYVDATTSRPNEYVPVGLITLANWPLIFGILFIAFTFVLPRFAKKKDGSSF
jgi:hypothetical protein